MLAYALCSLMPYASMTFNILNKCKFLNNDGADIKLHVNYFYAHASTNRPHTVE